MTAGTATQPSPSFWLALESVPGGSALPTTWKRHLGPEFQTFASLFLKARRDDPAAAVPCPFNCSCFHKVVPQENGTLHGVCQCSPQRCETYTVLPDEIIPLELDWPKITQVLCRAFRLQPRTVKFGLYNTLQIGAWSADAVPVILTLSMSRPEFLNIIAVLVARLGQPFILLAPTNRHLGPAAKELLDSLGAGFFSLNSILEFIPPPEPDLDPSVPPMLVPKTPPEKLFADIAPLLPPLSEEDLVRRTFLALQDSESDNRARKPTLYTVFQHYCVQELTARQTARKCRCSLGTISKRLVELRRRTGVSPARLRPISSHFTQWEKDLAEARSNYHRRHHLRD